MDCVVHKGQSVKIFGHVIGGVGGHQKSKISVLTKAGGKEISQSPRNRFLGPRIIQHLSPTATHHLSIHNLCGQKYSSLA